MSKLFLFTFASSPFLLSEPPGQLLSSMDRVCVWSTCLAGLILQFSVYTLFHFFSFLPIIRQFLLYFHGIFPIYLLGHISWV